MPYHQNEARDVKGETPIDVSHGEAVKVASASFDPGYSLDTTLKAGFVTKADLVQGYCAYGKAVGESED